MTRQQRLVFELATASSAHPTAEIIFREAKKVMPDIGLATVYRNLNQLAEEGKIRRIRVNGDFDHFDKTLAPHEHALCPVCGKMRDVNVEGIRRQIALGLSSDDFTYDLTIYECCPACRDQQIYNKQNEGE